MTPRGTGAPAASPESSGDRDSEARQRLLEAGDLTDACELLSPYTRDHFTASFDSFDEYEAWRNEQPNPWNR